MSKRWPWPCGHCGHPCFEHIPNPGSGGVTLSKYAYKCPFAASYWRGMTALAFVNNMMEWRINDLPRWKIYNKRIAAALGELHADLLRGPIRIAGKAFLRDKALP